MSQFNVPFGKYKGEKLEVLLTDRTYLSWFIFKTDFPDKYPEICETLMHILVESDNEKIYHLTLQENALQIDFLNSNFCITFVKHYVKRCGINMSDWRFEGEILNSEDKLGISDLQFESNNCNVSFKFKYVKGSITHTMIFCIWILGSIDENYRTNIAYLNKMNDKTSNNILYFRDFLVKSISKVNLIALLKHQRIFLMMENELKPESSFLDSQIIPISSNNEVGPF